MHSFVIRSTLLGGVIPIISVKNSLSSKKIFISYAREDYKYAERLYDDLKNAGLNPWIDKKNLRPGENWKIALRNAIKDSRFVILLLSTILEKRRFVHREFRIALDILDEFLETDIFIIPVRLDECDIPYEQLRDIQYVDLFPESSWEEKVNEILLVIKEELQKIEDNDKNQNPPKNEINETIPLTKIDREKEATWTNLLYSIKEKKCIPFIGEEASLPWLNKLKDLSSNWAEEYQYPLEDAKNLSSVTNFLAIENGNNIIPKNDLSQILSKIKPPDFSQEEYDNTPYSVLSKLPLSIYITTNYDHFMEAALISRGRQPVSDICRWTDDLLRDEVYADLSKNFSKVVFSFNETKLRSVSDQGSEYEPTVERPLVYHLYGDIAVPQSMVLTEKDYFDFIINLNKNDGKTFLNPFIYQIITSTPLLLIGYTLKSIFFRLLLKSLSEKSHLSNNIIVLLPISTIENNKRPEEYFTKYLKDMFKASVFWIDNNDFSKELRLRWNKFKM